MEANRVFDLLLLKQLHRSARDLGRSVARPHLADVHSRRPQRHLNSNQRPRRRGGAFQLAPLFIGKTHSHSHRALIVAVVDHQHMSITASNPGPPSIGARRAEPDMDRDRFRRRKALKLVWNPRLTAGDHDGRNAVGSTVPHCAESSGSCRFVFCTQYRRLTRRSLIHLTTRDVFVPRIVRREKADDRESWLLDRDRGVGTRGNVVRADHHRTWPIPMRTRLLVAP